MTYFVIYCNEDGEVWIKDYTKDQLLEELEEGSFSEFRDNLKENNPQYWGDSVLIIKGEIVTPTPKTVVTEYEIGG